MRASGVAGTRLLADAIGRSSFPDTALEDRFERDTVEVRMGIAPDLTLVLGVPLGEETEIQLAAGYTFGPLRIAEGGDSRDAGSLAAGHVTVSARKPVRGVLARLGVGVLWFQGGDITALREMRTLNPLLELAAGKAWNAGGFALEAALVAQAAQIASSALEVRQGPPGMYYRLGIELGFGRRVGQ